MENRRIVLTGYRGTGKSSIGKNMADILGLDHVDIDTLIERESGQSIPDIFRNCGEEEFRKIESRIIRELPTTPAVISTGGGAVLRSENVRALRRKSQIILLTSSEDDIARRITGTSRPSLTGLSLQDEIHTVLTERMPIYQAAADITYDSSGKRPREAASDILKMIRPGSQLSNEIEARNRLVDWILTTPVPPTSHSSIRAMTEDPDIRLYGILGDPCMHSLSPPIWNRLFQDYEMPARYTWFECPDIRRFLPAAQAAGVRGLSVTIPHKERIIPLLDEVHHDARVIGAVNTVLLLGGKRYGFNTDWKGIYRPLEGVTGDTAVILGAGGAAAAAVYAVTMRGFSPVILNRTPERARELALRVGAGFGSLSDFDRYNPDLVINATPIGMKSTQNKMRGSEMPVPASSLSPDMHVFDLVYTPVETPLLRAALEAGCSIIPGTEMFIHQLVEQFRILTGIDVPADRVRGWIL